MKELEDIENKLVDILEIENHIKEIVKIQEIIYINGEEKSNLSEVELVMLEISVINKIEEYQTLIHKLLKCKTLYVY